MDVKPVKAGACFCSNDTHDGADMFTGLSECDSYMMQIRRHDRQAVNKTYTVTFHAPEVSGVL